MIASFQCGDTIMNDEKKILGPHTKALLESQPSTEVEEVVSVEESKLSHVLNHYGINSRKGPSR